MPYIMVKNGKRRVRAEVMVNGKRKTKFWPDASKVSQREAAAWETEAREKMTQSQMSTEYLTLGKWVNEYLTDVQRRRMVKKVYEEKRSAFMRLAAFTLKNQIVFSKDTPVESISRFQVKAHFNRMLDAGRSGNAVLKDRKNLGAAWTWGRNNIADWPSGENPFLSVSSQEFPRTRKARYVPGVEDFWKLHDWIKSRAAAKNPSHVQDFAMFMVALHLAARRGEIFRMKLDDLDFSRNQVRLWTRKRKGGVMECDWLPMTKELRAALLSWIEVKLTLPGITSDTLFVCVDQTAFCDEHYGKPFTARAHAMKRWCDAVEIKPFGWHAIRHFTASTIFNRGYPLAHVQTILRHQDPHTTDRYIRSLGLTYVRASLEEGLKRDAEIIPFPQQKQDSCGLAGDLHPSFTPSTEEKGVASATP